MPLFFGTPGLWVEAALGAQEELRKAPPDDGRTIEGECVDITDKPRHHPLRLLPAATPEGST